MPTELPASAPAAPSAPEAVAPPAGTPPESAAVQALIPTFDSIKANVFARSCLQCHATGGHASDYPLDDRTALLAVDGLVIAGRPDDSDLIRVLVPGSGARPMPPRRSNLPAVTESEIAVLREWILRGMP